MGEGVLNVTSSHGEEMTIRECAVGRQCHRGAMMMQERHVSTGSAFCDGDGVYGSLLDERMGEQLRKKGC